MDEKITVSDRRIFNSYLEAGVRILCILNALSPKGLDFESLIKTDYVLVNSNDFSGPKSLHSKLPNRKGELVTRRESIRQGLELMRRFGLVSVILSQEGAVYYTTEKTKPYLKLMVTTYSKELQIVALWLSKEINTNSFHRIDELLKQVVYS
ncbi:ABC-three component system middle component 2 [Photobacterium indicum]|uniref:Threonine transporter n=1 Tax=Photobacterium indicum TaxID=81447 RepID=A0A2T3LAG8_9GAMM|nr:ABC-three component system middle component 2 [Photobacterium indicum]PSV48336.1 threonine transporter [Photobacterium indicum]